MLRNASLIALAASVLAHGVLLKTVDGALGVPAEAPLPEMTLVEVRIPPAEPLQVATAAPQAPPAAAVAKPAPRPTPKPRKVPAPQSAPKPETEAAAVVPVSVEPPAPAAVDEAAVDASLADVAPTGDNAIVPGGAEPAELQAAAAEAADTAAPTEPALDPQALDLSSWPANGSILFRVTYGEGGFEVGRAEHRWSHDDQHYEMETALETTGVTALFRSFRYVQRSVGGLGKAGLRPERFSVEQAGKKPEWASFDWDGGVVTIQRRKDTRTAPIHPGDQDVLSLWHQIGIVGADGLPLELTVVSNKAASPSRLSTVGTETLQLPIGRLDTLHIRAQAKDGKLSIDIWLARHYGMLPVRIRIVDDKGEIFDQQAVNLRLAPPPGRSDGDAGGTQMVELREQVDPFTLYK